MKIPTSGRIWAYIGIAVGLGISLAGNVAATFLHGARPSWVDLGAAGFAPVAVFISIEVLVRNPWPEQRRWTLIKWAFSMIVAPAAAVISFIHLAELTMNGHRADDYAAWTVALLTPLMIDGVVAGCAAALLIPAAVSEPEIEPLVLPVPAAVLDTEPIVLEHEEPAIAERSAPTAAPKRAPSGLKARWLAEGWDDERALKEIAAERPDASERANREVLRRWKNSLDK